MIATQKRLVGRAVLNTRFRERLFADPEKAVREEGFDLSAEEMAVLSKIDRARAKKAIEKVVFG